MTSSRSGLKRNLAHRDANGSIILNEYQALWISTYSHTNLASNLNGLSKSLEKLKRRNEPADVIADETKPSDFGVRLHCPP